MDFGVPEPPRRGRMPRPHEPFVNLIKVLIGSNSEPRDPRAREPIPPIILYGCRQPRLGRRHAPPSDLHRALEPAAADRQGALPRPRPRGAGPGGARHW